MEVSRRVKWGRPAKVVPQSTRTCPTCEGVGWYVAPGTVSDIDWDWPCQECDTSGHVEKVPDCE